jgi:type I restriction enzyme S subunit
VGKWEISTINEISKTKLEYGSGASSKGYDGNVRYIRITDILDDGKLNDNITSPNEYDDKYLLNDGDILFARSGATVGKTFRYRKLFGKAIYAGYLIRLIPDTSRVLPDYVFYYTKTPYYNDFIKMNSKTVAQPNINAKQYGELKIPIPPLDVQQKIADVLDKASELIDLRKAQLYKLDLLIKSQFIEMFGDPVLNQKKFPVYTVDDIIEFQGGSQPDKKYFEYEKTDDNIRLIQIRDYKSNRFVTYIPKAMAKRFCKADDIMIGRYGPPIFQILQGIEGSFNVALMKAILRKGNREFVRHFLKQECLLHYLEGLSQRTAGQDGIQMDKLKAYPFPYPPIEFQEQFANFVIQVDKSKFAMKLSLSNLELNYNSLLQKCFRGEIF